MILEFKAPEVPLNNEVFLQIAHYNSQIAAQYMAVSNGMQTYIAQIKAESNEIVFLTDIPTEIRWTINKLKSTINSFKIITYI